MLLYIKYRRVSETDVRNRQRGDKISAPSQQNVAVDSLLAPPCLLVCLCVISGCRREVAENCALLGYCASSRVKNWKLVRGVKSKGVSQTDVKYRLGAFFFSLRNLCQFAIYIAPCLYLEGLRGQAILTSHNK